MKRFVAVLLSLSLLVCLRAEAQTAETGKIGAFLSLTGATASYGVSALNAIKLATEEANRAGGINGKQIELVVEDDHSNTQEVPGIVTRLIKEAKVHALLAEPVSARAMAAAPIAQSNRIVMMNRAPCATHSPQPKTSWASPARSPSTRSVTRKFPSTC